MKRIISIALALLLCAGTCLAAGNITAVTLLADLLSAYEDPTVRSVLRIDADAEALDDEIMTAVASHWKKIWIDPDYRLFIYGVNDPSSLEIPDPSKHAFVVLGYELKNGEMTDELKLRCDAAAAAAGAFPGSILVCSGGATGTNNPEQHTEAGLMKAYLSEVCGIDGERIFTDERAKNTAQNAINTYEILREMGMETMTIVTSSYHQRRAQTLYNALSAQYQQDTGYSAKLIGNFCCEVVSAAGNADDARLTIQQLGNILGLPSDEMDLLPGNGDLKTTMTEG